MKSRNGLYLALAALLLTVALYLWLRTQHIVTTQSLQARSANTPQSTPSSSSPSTPIGQPAPVPSVGQTGTFPRMTKPELIATYLGMLGTPISFYGKVFDDKGVPVSGAHITYQAANQLDPNASNPKYTGTSDDYGNFTVSGLHGALLYVDVSKDGYYRTPPFDGHRGSYDGFTYAGVRSKDSVPPPTGDNPAIFVLRKKRNGIALIHLGRSISVQKDGTPIEVDLESNKHLLQDLKVECWTEDQTKDARGHYPWHCQVSVPGGGLANRDGEFDFEAPEEGYVPSEEIAPPKDRWSPQVQRQYFVKTMDGHYARVTVDMVAGGDHFVTVESYFNPTPGDRNLESASQ